MDVIIEPSPPDTGVQVREEEKIKRLRAEISRIKNITGPLYQYIEFNSDITSNIQLSMNIDRWLLLFLFIKSLVKIGINDELSRIKNPPDNLIFDVKAVTDEIEDITDEFVAGLKNMSSKLQTLIELEQDKEE